MELEVLNDTYWPWKPSCSITLSDEQTETVIPIEVFNVQVENNV